LRRFVNACSTSRDGS